MKFDNTDEFMIALGSGAVTVAQVVNKLSIQEVEPEHEVFLSVPVNSPASGIEVLGVGDLLTRMANCCSPISGDDIIGYVTRSRGVTVHQVNCHNIRSEQETERLIPVGWGKTQTLYAWDRVGLLGDITSRVSEERVNIASCVSEEHGDVSVISLTVYINGIDQLNVLFSKLEGVGNVFGVSRARD